MSKNKENKDIKDQYLTFTDDDIVFSVVTALNWYESLNLKKLAIMLNKPESTTLRYIRKMKDSGIIVFDSEKSEDSWGKYYKLSDSTKKLYDNYIQALDEQVERIADELKDLSKFTEEGLQKYVIDKLLTEKKLEEIPLLKRYFLFISNLQNVMLNETINKITEFTKTVKPEDWVNISEKVEVSPMDISMYVNHIKISKWSHIFKINNLIFKFISQLDTLKKKIEKEIEEEIVPEEKQTTQFINIFTGNLDVSYEFKE